MLSLRDDHDEAKLYARKQKAWSRLKNMIANKQLVSWNDLAGKTVDRVIGQFIGKCVFITTEGQFLVIYADETGSLSVPEAQACKLFDEGSYSEWLIASDAVRKHTEQKCENDLIAEAIRVCGIDKVKAAVAAKDTE